MPAHSILTGTDLHEPKGIDAANVGEVYVADGAGSGAFEVLGSRTYGGISSHESTIAIATIGVTAQLFTGFDADMPANNLTPAHATDSITIITSGDYYITFSCTIATTAVGDAGTYHIHTRLDDVEDAAAPYGLSIELTGTTDTHSGSFIGIATLTAGQVVTTWIESDEAGDTDDIIVEGAALSLFLLKEA